jgi:hypothetical protein
VLILTALGLALAWYLLTHAGWQAVGTAATAVGRGGFALLCLAALLVSLILGPAWYVLPPSFGQSRDTRKGGSPSPKRVRPHRGCQEQSKSRPGYPKAIARPLSTSVHQ